MTHTRVRFDYLDGLRGLAALVVVFPHGIIHHAFGLYSGQPVDSRFPWDIELSGWSFLVPFAGNYAVAVFFLLSGFVLAHVFSRATESPFALLAKRYVRLTIPITAANLLAYGIALTAIAVPALLPYVPTGPGLAAGADFVTNAMAGLDFSLKEALVNATLTGIHGGTYNGVLWTMQIEFVGSMLLVLVFRAASALTSSVQGRLDVATAICLVLLLLWYPSNLALFAVGVVLYRMSGALIAAGHHAAAKYGAYPILIAGLYLGTCPESPGRDAILNEILRSTGTDLRSIANGSPLYAVFRGFDRDVWVPFPFLPVPLLHGAGAVLTLIGILLSPSLRRFTSTTPLTWLGAISFPLYLVHGVLLDITSTPTFHVIQGLGFSGTAALIGSMIVFVPTSLLIAATLGGAIEERAIRWSTAIGHVVAAPTTRRTDGTGNPSAVGSAATGAPQPPGLAPPRDDARPGGTMHPGR